MAHGIILYGTSLLWVIYKMSLGFLFMRFYKCLFLPVSTIQLVIIQTTVLILSTAVSHCLQSTLAGFNQQQGLT